MLRILALFSSVALGVAYWSGAVAEAVAYEPFVVASGNTGVGPISTQRWSSIADKLDIPGPERFEPLLGIEAGVLVLSRSADAHFPLVFTDGTSGPVEEIASSEILDSDAIVGSRIAVTMYNLTDWIPGLDAELVFMEVDDRLSREVVDANGNNTTDVIPVFFNGVPVSPNPSETFFLDGDLESWELSLGYRPMARLRFTAGLRWVDLREDFDIIETESLGTNTLVGFRSQTSNDAFGFQIGGEATIWTNGTFRVFASGKHAWLDNDVRGDAIAENFTIDYNDSVDSTLLDLEIGVTARIANWAHLQIAYQGLFLSDFAAVLGQSDALSIVSGPGQTPVVSDIDWNGVHFGLAFVW